VLVSIGSQIEDIIDTSSDGFSIKYVEGDLCNKQTGEKFRTLIHYVCDPVDNDHEDPKIPTFVN
jgi:hypothetical protein